MVLVLEAERREVAGADDDVGREVVDLGDRALEQRRLEVLAAAVQVGDVGDPEGRGGHVEQSTRLRGALNRVPGTSAS